LLILARCFLSKPQVLNDYGGSIDQLQMLTDHARRDSVMKYTEVKVEAKRRIVADIIKLRRHSVGTKSADKT